MGLLDDIMGAASGQSQSPQQSSGSGMSPLLLLLLGVLAYRGYKNGGIFGGGQNPASGNQTPAAGTTGSPAPSSGIQMPDLSSGGLGAILGGLGGLLGGATAGGASAGGLGGVLGDLMRKFEQQGLGNAANSWIGTGPNQAVTPDQLESAIGSDGIDRLAQEAGMPRQQVLAELSHGLPDVIDKLTPDGRLPASQA